MTVNTACRSYIPLLSPFVDGELSVADRRTVEQHLGVCKDCSGRAADLRGQSSLVRVGLELLADEADFSGFADRVMARITPERPSLLEQWRLSLSELFTYHRAAMVSSLVTAMVAALVAGSLVALRTGSPTGYASEQMAVRRVSTVPEAHVAPVVMKGDQGNAIIWLVDHRHLLDAQGGQDSGTPERPPSVQQPEINQERPHGGEL